MRWTAPTDIDQHPINGLACPSISFCVAVDDHGDVVSSNDPFAGAQRWRVSDVDGSRALTALACPSSSVCVAVDSQGNAITTGDAAGGESAWTVARIDASITEPSPYGGGPDLLRSISCPNPSFCVAVDSVGNAIYSGDPTGGQNAWATAHIDNNSDYGCTGGGLSCQAPLMGISCPALTLCATVDFTGNILQTTGPVQPGAWPSQAAGGGGPDSLWSVSCPSNSFCATVDGASGNVIDWDPAAGMKLTVHRLPVDAFGVWCRSETLCLASGQGSGGETELVGSTNPATRSPRWAVTGFGDITAVSCPTATTCLAADNQGQVMQGVTVTGLSATLRRQVLGTRIPKLATLLRDGGYKLRFASPLAGDLNVTWRTRGTVVASASRRFTAPQTESIRLRLTPSGRALLRGAGRVAVSAAATYSTNTGPVAVQRTLVLGR
jgi:hypothetical protein